MRLELLFEGLSFSVHHSLVSLIFLLFAFGLVSVLYLFELFLSVVS
jgi:hypothetical protein